MTDRSEFADFLRRKRESIRAVDRGLPKGSRRRTPGLRREEVARLADMSTDYYARLEQGRGSRPSAAIVNALARALGCDADERNHMFRLAGLRTPQRMSAPRLGQALLGLLQRLDDVPVLVCSDLSQVLWHNELADELFGPFEGLGDRAGNLTWRWFTDDAARARFPDGEREQRALALVSDLRAIQALRPTDDELASLIADLLQGSEEFRRRWSRHDVAVCRHAEMTIVHPEVGDVQLVCESLFAADGDVRVLAFMPAEVGSGDKLKLLRIIGNEIFASAHDDRRAPRSNPDGVWGQT